LERSAGKWVRVLALPSGDPILAHDADMPDTNHTAEDAAGGDTGSVWPPPPLYTPHLQNLTSRPRYIPTRLLSGFLISLAVLFVIVFLAEATFELTGGIPLAISESAFARFHVCYLLGETVVFLIWTFIVYRNLAALGITGLQHSAGSAIGWFFAPGLAFYRPLLVFIEIWKGSDPADDGADSLDWRHRPLARVVGIWWGAWLAWWALNLATMYMDATHSLEMDETLRDVAFRLIAVLWASASIVIIAQVDRRQVLKHRRLMEAASSRSDE
jgi:hypothetical protein